ncbi:hypothetical protein SGRIM128S_09392 [Streptomyces griseomycini]
MEHQGRLHPRGAHRLQLGDRSTGPFLTQDRSQSRGPVQPRPARTPVAVFESGSQESGRILFRGRLHTLPQNPDGLLELRDRSPGLLGAFVEQGLEHP